MTARAYIWPLPVRFRTPLVRLQIAPGRRGDAGVSGVTQQLATWRARWVSPYTAGLSCGHVGSPTRTRRPRRDPARGGTGCPHLVRGLDDPRPSRAPRSARTPPRRAAWSRVRATGFLHRTPADPLDHLDDVGGRG